MLDARQTACAAGTRARRLLLVLCCAVSLICPLALGSASYADTPVPTPSNLPTPPSQDQVDQAKKAAADKAARLQQINDQLAAAQQQLQQLQGQAETATENYNRAEVLLAQAQQQEQVADQQVSDATVQVATTQAKINALAAAAYRSGGSVSQLSSLMRADSLPDAVAEAGTYASVGHYQQDLLSLQAEQQLTLAQAQQAAESARQAQQQATQQAADAAQQATDLMNQQDAQTKTIENLQVDAQLEAEDASTKATNLEQERARILAEIEAAKKKAAEEARKKAEAEAKARAEAAAAAAAAAKKKAEEAAAAAAAAGRQSPPVAGSDQAAIAVQWAYKEIGVPYSWGGGTYDGPSTGIGIGRNTVGFDCSGLTMFVWNKAGVQLSHWTGWQWNQGTHIPHGQEQPGDLLFFATNTSNPATIHHVGIYIGNGQMINAPDTGEMVRIDSAWRNDLIGAVRP